MEKGLVYVNTDKASAFEAIDGNVIDEVVVEDSSADGSTVELITIKTYRQIENVKVGQDVYFEDEECFLSREYIVDIEPEPGKGSQC